MKYTDSQLNEAVKNDIFSDEQVNRFRDFVQKNRKNIEEKIINKLPAFILKLRPKR